MRISKLKSLLVKGGITQASIAEKCGVTAATVNLVISGRGRSEKVELAIAKKVGIPRNKIFPLWR